MDKESLRSDVSRETMEKLETYLRLLEQWNPKINLVASHSLKEAWSRHILDSLQLYEMADPRSKHWVDLGSGGGFPGLVIAILAFEKAPMMRVTLVESDARKCVFLRTVIREIGAKAEVLNERIEKIPPLKADVVSARALAALPKLLGYVFQHLAKDGVAILPKGATWKNEVDNARKEWQFDCSQRTSATNPNAVVLKIGALSHV